ncbi:energy transducer TonB [Fodinibius halophilus]|uniref:Energy transducer TonB n=1 Tax=Fodinibius halophilus TaxID=1736908 RepID=A0A6M1T085_9BACT|nr:energy transducer TonB [Fodinibius halophilus]NGP88896.1 energy transducer TonB [Fodinibius halophilus]
MSCIIAAELIALAFFTLWPAPGSKSENKKKATFNDDTIVMDEAVITTQASTPPPPPKPRAPVPVPKDEIIEEKIIVFEDINSSDFTDSLSISKLKGAGNSDQVASSPQQPPTVIRIVEAVMPDAAKEAGIKAEVTVRFLVDKKGRVEDARIELVKVYPEGSDEPRFLDSIGYGIAEATLRAAQQWKFRPAKNNGKPVRAYSKQVFTFGF